MSQHGLPLSVQRGPESPIRSPVPVEDVDVENRRRLLDTNSIDEDQVPTRGRPLDSAVLLFCLSSAFPVPRVPSGGPIDCDSAFHRRVFPLFLSNDFCLFDVESFEWVRTVMARSILLFFFMGSTPSPPPGKILF